MQYDRQSQVENRLTLLRNEAEGPNKDDHECVKEWSVHSVEQLLFHNETFRFDREA